MKTMSDLNYLLSCAGLPLQARPQLSPQKEAEELIKMAKAALQDALEIQDDPNVQAALSALEGDDDADDDDEDDCDIRRRGSDPEGRDDDWSKE